MPENAQILNSKTIFWTANSLNSLKKLNFNHNLILYLSLNGMFIPDSI